MNTASNTHFLKPDLTLLHRMFKVWDYFCPKPRQTLCAGLYSSLAFMMLFVQAFSLTNLQERNGGHKVQTIYPTTFFMLLKSTAHLCVETCVVSPNIRNYKGYVEVLHFKSLLYQWRAVALFKDNKSWDACSSAMLNKPDDRQLAKVM